VAIRALGALVAEGDPNRLECIVEAVAREATWRPVLRAPSGPVALGLLEAFIPGLLILDAETPAVCGLEILRRIRRDRRYRYTAVVVTGSQGVDEQREDWLPGEVWLPKPFELDDLETAVRLAISRLITEYERHTALVQGSGSRAAG
jgi:two-component system response regulator YesN